MHIERLTMLADMLDNLPPKNFNLAFWGRETECGTVACAVGWACMMPVFQKQGLTMNWEHEEGAPMFNGKLAFSAAQEFFKLSYNQAQELFSFLSYASLAATEPWEVAARIRELLAFRGKRPDSHKHHVVSSYREVEVLD